MNILGFRIEVELKEKLENNIDNEIKVVENVTDFIEALKDRRYECVLVEEMQLPDRKSVIGRAHV